MIRNPMFLSVRKLLAIHATHYNLNEEMKQSQYQDSVAALGRYAQLVES